MTCSTPPLLSDEDINMALDGVASPEIMVHLAQCTECASRLAAEQRFEQQLRAPLNRWDCPDPEELGVYHLGLLGGPEERTIMKHLTVCMRCAEEIEVLRAFLADDAVQQPKSESTSASGWQPRTQLRSLVVRLIPTRPGFGAAAVRGGGRAPMVAQSAVATIVLDPVEQGPAETMLVGQIADDEDDQDRWTGALVSAYREGLFVGAAVVDDLGSFTCGPLPSGSLHIHITSETGPSIKIEDVPI
jgi:hypothetical protein